jgi:hypothetical protein
MSKYLLTQVNSKAEELQQAFNNLQKFLTQLQSDKDDSL